MDNHRMRAFTGLECLCPTCLSKLLKQAGQPHVHQWLYLLAAREHHNRQRENLIKSSSTEIFEQLDVAMLSTIAKNVDGRFGLSERIAAVDELLRR